MFRIYGRFVLLFWLLPAGIPSAFAGEPFLCAGFPTHSAEGMPEERAAKTVVLHTEGTRSAVVLFAKFKGEAPEKIQAPAWADDIFDSDLPGSFTHFYDTMSFGRLHVAGEAMPRYYESVQKASAYLAESDTTWGAFGRFSLEILQQADADVDFSRFDNDGPDGISDSGDDDGVVDVVFLLTASTPANFLFRRATGVASLGLDEAFITDDVGIDGQPIRIASRHGAVQRGHTFAAAVGAMCHEYGHLLGLPDLYNTAFLHKRDAGPEEDSAGIGNWGLMGRGTLGWFGNDGPSSFCAWSRMKLGWARVREISREREELRLPEVGREGNVYKIPFEADEFFLLEHRLRTSTFYDRHLPGEGLLIWHVELKWGAGSRLVDLECADGRWLDVGYPLGEEPDARWGGDNLDFWAHDEAYAEAHGGNLGDATDPFGGVQYPAFTPETNPDSYGCDGRDSVRIEEIRFEGDLAIAQVQTDPAVVEMGTPWVLDASKDMILYQS